MIDEIIFRDDYFKEIIKVEHIRDPRESTGTFSEIIKVYYKPKWFGLFRKSETFKLNSKEEAKKMLEKLQIIMNGEHLLKDLLNEEVK